MDPSDLYTALAKGNDVVVLHMRQVGSYKREHIPGAVSFPHRKMNTLTTKDLDKSKVYVCYCDGIGCNTSTRGALNMAKLGFKVQELIGGIEWWKFDGYATEGNQVVSADSMQCAC